MATFRIDALFFVVAAIITNCPIGHGKISCKNAKGKDVDCILYPLKFSSYALTWRFKFVVYKVPKTKPNGRSFKQPNGGEMAYYDHHSKKIIWTLLDADINSTTGNPIYNTLKPIYEKGSKVAFLAYNDQAPHMFKGTRGGHTKGVLMAGQGADFGTVWLQHSVPRFVGDVKEKYSYPNNGRENGQLFLCITFPLGTVEKISYHLQLQAANVYQVRYLPWTDSYPLFAALLKGEYLRKLSGIRVDILFTRKTRPVLAIAKSHKWLKDIYREELIGQMNDSMHVQTWQNGAGGAQSVDCRGRYQVTDIQEVDVRTQKGILSFSSKEDHSKWSVAQNKAVFCFSSLNRMISQWKRGGEITCILDVSLASLFRASIFKRNQCKGRAEK